MNRMSAVPAAILTRALLSSPAQGAAQELRVGGGLGMSLSTFGGDAPYELDGYRAGVAGGPTLSYAIAPLLPVESGAWWVEKGAEGTVQGFEEPISAESSCSWRVSATWASGTSARRTRSTLRIGVSSWRPGSGFRSDRERGIGRDRRLAWKG